MERQDVGMRQTRRDLDLAQKALMPERECDLGQQDLQRHPPVMLVILGQVDDRHATAAELAHDLVGAQPIAGLERLSPGDARHHGARSDRRGFLQEGAGGGAGSEQPLDLGAQRRVTRAHGAEQRDALLGRHLECGVEQLARSRPSARASTPSSQSQLRSSWYSHPLAFTQSRSTVRAVTPRATAVSSSVSPAK